MKKNIFTYFLLASMLLLSASCTGRFEEFNRDPSGATDEEVGRMGYAINSTMLSMANWVIPTQVHQHQFIEVLAGANLGGYFASVQHGFNGSTISTFNNNDHWTSPGFNAVIPPVFIAWNDLRDRTDNPILLAVSDIMRVMAMVRVTDTYGPIPFSQIGEGGALTAPYDSQEAIYRQMFEELSSAIETLTANSTVSFSPLADHVFGGNVVSWVRLANSMKLRMAMRISNADSVLARAMAEAAVSHEIGVMTANAHNAFMPVVGANPLFMQTHEWNDERISADLTSVMNGFNDPRRERMFTVSTFDGGITNGFIGMRAGVLIPPRDITGTANFSNVNMTSGTPVMWMNAAEISFLRAEGALRGWTMGGTAEHFYNEGIRLSFEQWGATGYAQFIADYTSTPDAYVDPLGLFTFTGVPSNITIMWDEADNFERNLERIITQKWIAMFPLGIEAWSTYRRTGFPRLMPAVLNNSGGIVTPARGARRLPFPQRESLENLANLQYAISNYLDGPDNMGTDVWWARQNP